MATDRMEEIKDELNSVLEARIGDLLGSIRATHEVAQRLASTEDEIRRNSALKARLEEELGPLTDASRELETENGDLQAKVDKLQENVEKMRQLKAQLMSNLSSLKSQLDE